MYRNTVKIPTNFCWDLHWPSIHFILFQNYINASFLYRLSETYHWFSLVRPSGLQVPPSMLGNLRVFRHLMSLLLLLMAEKSQMKSPSNGCCHWTDLTDDRSTVQVMAWCIQAASNYQSQFWPMFMPQYVFNRPQCVNLHHVMGTSVLLAYYIQKCKPIFRETVAVSAQRCAYL